MNSPESSGPPGSCFCKTSECYNCFLQVCDPIVTTGTPPTLSFVNLFYFFWVSKKHFILSFIFTLIFYSSFILSIWGFVCSSFSISYRCKVRLFIWDFVCFLKYSSIAMNIPLENTFAACHRFWYIVFLFSFVWKYLLTSLLISYTTHCLFSSMLFNLRILGVFTFFWWLVFSFIPLWSEKMFAMISVFLNQFRFVLWPTMWFIPENIPHALENNVSSAPFGGMVCMYIY